MRKPTLTFLAAATIVATIVGSSRSAAKPCPADAPESLALDPRSFVTFDGSRVDSMAGCIHTDAGQGFCLITAVATAFDVQTQCINNTEGVWLRVIDPFTGDVADLELSVHP